MRANSFFMIALVLPVFTVCAAEQSLPTVGDLSKVQSETIMYDAQAKRAEAKAKMQEQLMKAGDDPATSQVNTAPSVVASDLPTITGISGVAGRLLATFRYSNGTTVSSKSGQQIPGGFMVAEVGIDRVVLTKGDRRMPLQFGVASEPAASTMPFMLPGQVPGFYPPSPSPMH